MAVAFSRLECYH